MSCDLKQNGAKYYSAIIPVTPTRLFWGIVMH